MNTKVKQHCTQHCTQHCALCAKYVILSHTNLLERLALTSLLMRACHQIQSTLQRSASNNNTTKSAKNSRQQSACSCGLNPAGAKHQFLSTARALLFEHSNLLQQTNCIKPSLAQCNTGYAYCLVTPAFLVLAHLHALNWWLPHCVPVQAVCASTAQQHLSIF